MAAPSDAQLVADLKSNPRAFRALYDRHAGVLLRFIYRFTGNQQLAEEVLHDVFVEVLDGKFGEGDLKAWLFATAKNKSLNVQRRLKHEARDIDAAEVVDGADLEADTNLVFLRHKLATADLPADLRETWQLRQQGLDYQQIAAQLAIPVGTVKSRFHRLVLYFREELDI